MKKRTKNSADYWVAMSSDSNIHFWQKIIIGWSLSYHLVHPECAPQHEIAKVGTLHVEFQQEAIYVDSRRYGVKKVDCFCLDLSIIIKMHSAEIFQYVEENFNIGVLLRGDHGKGIMIFVDFLIMRFRTKNKNPKIIELQIGELDSSKDTMELLRFIL